MNWDQLVGQAAARERFERMQQTGRVPHALLVNGPPGAGQLPFAMAAGRELLASEGGSTVPKDLTQHPDVHLVLPIVSKQEGGRPQTTGDFLPAFREAFAQRPYLSLGDWGASLEAGNKQLLIPIHEIRNLRQKVQLKTFGGGMKLILIWHIERMNAEAANAFLKLLEEPSEGTVLLLTSEQGAALLPTITSRCQQLMLKPLPPADIAHYLQTAQGADAQRAEESARLAGGSIARALQVLDQAEQPLTEAYQQWMRACFAGDFEQIQAMAERFARGGKEFQKLFLDLSLSKLRDAMLTSAGAAALARTGREEQAFVANFARFLRREHLEEMIHHLEEARANTARNANATMLMTVLSLQLNAILRRASREQEAAAGAPA